MKNSVFLSYILLLFCGFLAAFGYARNEFSPLKVLQARLSVLEEEKARAEFRSQLAAHQLVDYQQQIATLLPGVIEKTTDPKQAYPLRQLASVVIDSDQLQMERASGMMEKAKEQFRDQEFVEANKAFANLIENYPDSIHVVEAHFLLAEGQFQLKEFEQSLATIEKMVDLFPENVLTGFALLRLGKIFEQQDRLEDAADVYRSVRANFSDGDITKQAETYLKGVAL